jgi:hypothetical protein
METDDFNEEQKFTQKWLLFLLYSLLVLSLLVSLLVLLEKKAGLFTSILPFVIMSFIVLFFKTVKLQTRITDEGIYYRFFPLERSFRVIKKSDIEKLEVKSYDPLREYGGWGIKYGKNGWADSVKGNKGIYISLAAKKHLLIGTSKPDKVEAFLKARGYNVK